MPAPNPAMSQWQQRFDASSAAVRAAEQSKDPARVRAAYDQLRQVQTAKPIGSATAKSPSGRLSNPQAPKAGVGGVFNYIANAMKGGK